MLDFDIYFRTRWKGCRLRMCDFKILVIMLSISWCPFDSFAIIASTSTLQRRWDVTAVRTIQTVTGLRTWMKSVNTATAPYLLRHVTQWVHILIFFLMHLCYIYIFTYAPWCIVGHDWVLLCIWRGSDSVQCKPLLWQYEIQSAVVSVQKYFITCITVKEVVFCVCN